MKKIIYFLSAISLTAIIYSACTDVPKKKEYTKEEKELIAIGKQAVDASFKTLSTQLKGALAEGGVPNAIPYCKNVATNITDSLSKQYGFEVSRTAMKVRNPENKADQIDEVVMLTMENAIKTEKPIEPILLKLSESEQYRVYYPIMLKPLCKSCHGIVSKEISDENYDLILEHYPNDEAVNFFDGSLRGTWKVVFPFDTELSAEG